MAALYSYEIGVQFTGTGTAASTAASKVVTGAGGAIFLTEFDDGGAAGVDMGHGYLITIAGETRVVDFVTNDTSLTVLENFTVGSAGQQTYTGVNLENLEDLTTEVYPPKSTFQEFSQPVLLGDGTVRGAGWITGEWRWGFLTQAQRNQLRTFCTGASNAVFIRTHENDNSDEYTYFSGTLVWPTGNEEKDAGFRLDLVARFQNLTEVVVA